MSVESLTPSRPTEHKVEAEEGWSLDRKTGKTTPWLGIRLRWRFVGERRWRSMVIVPDADLGQTVETLWNDAQSIVDVLAEQAS